MRRDSTNTWNSQLHQDLLAGDTIKDGQTTQHHQHTKSLADHMDSFKKKFMVRLVFGLLAFSAIMFQMFFYWQFYYEENKLIIDVQSVLLGEQISSTLRVLSYLCQPFYIHLVTLHILFTIYYGSDCVLGLKLIVNNLVALSVNKVVLLLHQEPRPYWLNPEDRSMTIDGYGCVTSYSNPDMSVIHLLITGVNFLLIDTQLKKLKNGLHIPLAVPYICLFASLVVYACLYVGGQVYLSQFAISVIYAFLYYHLLAWLNPTVSTAIRKCTFEAAENFRGHTNHFMLFLIAVVGEALVLIGHNSKNLGPKAIFSYVRTADPDKLRGQAKAIYAGQQRRQVQPRTDG